MDIGALGVYTFVFLALYFEVFLIISFLEQRPGKKTPTLPKRYPSVTIIVPCWNKEKTLGKTVESLLALTYPKEKLAILIVDDGSTDGTLAAAQAFTQNPQVKILSKKNEGSKYAVLNFGLAHSQSELFGCLDADSFVVPDALLEVVKKFESDPAIAAVTPAMKVYHPHTFLELIQATEYMFGIFYRKMFDTIGAISVLPGPFSFYRREVFEVLGYFREAHHTEDMEMAFRLHEHGLKIVNAHTALCIPKSPQHSAGWCVSAPVGRAGLWKTRVTMHTCTSIRGLETWGSSRSRLGIIGFIGGIYMAAHALYSLFSYGVLARNRHVRNGYLASPPAPSLTGFLSTRVS